jgi:hypothetical protein
MILAPSTFPLPSTTAIIALCVILQVPNQFTYDTPDIPGRPEGKPLQGHLDRRLSSWVEYLYRHVHRAKWHQVAHLTFSQMLGRQQLQEERLSSLR